MRRSIPLTLLAGAALALVPAGGCASETNSQDASKLYAATTSALATVQAKAVASTTGVNLDYIGPCDAEGSYHVHGIDDDAAGSFELDVTFTHCVAPDRVALDGDMHWVSAETSGTLTGSIAFSDRTTSASCDLDLQFTFAGGAPTYAGTVCGYDVGTF